MTAPVKVIRPEQIVLVDAPVQDLVEGEAKTVFDDSTDEVSESLNEEFNEADSQELIADS